MAVIRTSPLFSHRNGLTRVHPMILHRKQTLEHCGLQKWGIEYSWILHFEMCHYGKWSLSQLPVQDAGPRVPELLWGISLGNSTTICSTGKTGKLGGGANGANLLTASNLGNCLRRSHSLQDAGLAEAKVARLMPQVWHFTTPVSKTTPKRWKVKSY